MSLARRNLAVRSATAWLLLAAALLGGCAALPRDVSRPVSHALVPRPENPLARIAAASMPDGAASGFRLLPLGTAAFDARIALAEHAKTSLDVQYYLIQKELSVFGL